ncbi:MAG: hypothetical protein DYH12_01640 [Sorangiineae bacterium PRO1]|nr:hypothetical protein [Sorangiineae bacterium PRO1]
MDGLEALRKENAELRAQVAQLLTELARLTERVSELLAVAQRKQRKVPAPGAAAPAATPPVVEREARRAFEERPKAPDKPATEPPPKKKARPTGRKPIPGHLEAEEHELRPDACGECGGAALDVVDELVEEKLHVVVSVRPTAFLTPGPRSRTSRGHGEDEARGLGEASRALESQWPDRC